MIKVNTTHIVDPEGLRLSGEEDSAILELDAVRGTPFSHCSPIHYDLNAQLVGQDLLVTGKAWVELETECASCLEPMKTRVGDFSICIHIEKVPEEEVDLTDEIREDILLAMPSRFKCSETCKGICPGCGANLNREKCRCSAKKKKNKKDNPADNVWGALDQLKL